MRGEKGCRVVPFDPAGAVVGDVLALRINFTTDETWSPVMLLEREEGVQRWVAVDRRGQKIEIYDSMAHLYLRYPRVRKQRPLGFQTDPDRARLREAASW